RRGGGPENIFRTQDIQRNPLAPNQLVLFPMNFIDPLDYRDNNAVGGKLPFASEWAEIAWFLAPSPNGSTANGTPLFNLYRRQMLLIPRAPLAVQINTTVNGAEIAVGSGN